MTFITLMLTDAVSFFLESSTITRKENSVTASKSSGRLITRSPLSSAPNSPPGKSEATILNLRGFSVVAGLDVTSVSTVLPTGMLSSTLALYTLWVKARLGVRLLRRLESSLSLVRVRVVME